MVTKGLEIKKKSEQTTATYTKGGYRVEITYNESGGNIESINMSIYTDTNGNYLCNANASSNGSELTYNISSVPQSKLSEISALIEEVNSAIAANIASEAAE